ncbi:MAG: hypothetical protein WKF94_02385 [Solirubrobacteraceae bacterium]
MTPDRASDLTPGQARRWFTEPRFRPYLDEADGRHELAAQLYVWNARVSSVLLETLHHVEVLLRNAIDDRFKPVDSSAPPRETWLEDPAILNAQSRKRVAETIGRIRREGKKPTRGRVVAGLSFGFWRALFDKKYDSLWVSHLHRAFPHGGGDRAEIAATMASLVPFRNRIAHHETIIRRPIQRHHDELLRLASLIDPEAATWIRTHSRFDEVAAERPEP